MKAKNVYLRDFSLKILALCTVTSQERFLIKIGLWWRAYGSSPRYFWIKPSVKCCALFAWSFSILLWTGPSNQVRGKSLFLYNVPQRPIIKIRNQKWYFVTKIVLTYCEKKCSSDWEKLLKFEVEGRAFAKFLRSLIQQFIQIVKGQNNFW